MTSTCDVDVKHKDWTLLYLAAIREKDKSLLAKRISDAEHAIFLREREIFYTDAKGTSLEEKDALEDALYALRALESARQHSGVL